jgi:hypothetical protein
MNPESTKKQPKQENKNNKELAGADVDWTRAKVGRRVSHRKQS